MIREVAQISIREDAHEQFEPSPKSFRMSMV